mgnify:CR=1 FL=1
MLQMMAYEPMTLLIAVGFYLATGSFRVDDIIQTKYICNFDDASLFVGYILIMLSS